VTTTPSAGLLTEPAQKSRLGARPAPSYLGGAIVATLMFPPVGIAALFHVFRARHHDKVGAHEEARIEAEKARSLVWWGVGLGLTLGCILFVVVLLTNNNGAVRQTFLDWDNIKRTWPAVFRAFKTNISLFMVTEAIVLVWALVVAIIRSIPGPAAKPVRFLAVVYTDVFRGLPAVLVIYIVFYGFRRAGLPIVENFSDYQAGVFALTLVYGAYVCEVYRAGIDSIHWSQTAAARSLGLSFAKTMRHVVVPQAVRRIIPPLLNDFIGLQKDTALVSFVGTLEAFNVARNEASLTGNLSALTGVALCFLVITIPLARLTDYLVRRDQRRMRANG
jgi:polar amino acid transport system permease protein